MAELAVRDISDDQHRNRSDLQLVAEALAGSTVAWDAILRAHYRATWELSYALTRNKQLAEDLLQDSFLKIKEKLEQYRGESPLRGWILTICRNQYRDDLKYRTRRVGDTEIDAMVESDSFWLEAARRAGGEDPAEAWVMRMDLERALAELGEEEREAYALLMVVRYTSEEAGNLCGVAATTMRSRLARARERLGQLLPAYGEEDA